MLDRAAVDSARLLGIPAEEGNSIIDPAPGPGQRRSLFEGGKLCQRLAVLAQKFDDPPQHIRALQDRNPAPALERARGGVHRLPGFGLARESDVRDHRAIGRVADCKGPPVARVLPLSVDPQSRPVSQGAETVRTLSAVHRCFLHVLRVDQ